MKKLFQFFNKFKLLSWLALIILATEILEKVVSFAFGDKDGLIRCFGISFLITAFQVILFLIIIINVVIIIAKADKRNILLLGGSLLFALFLSEFLLYLFGIDSIATLNSKIPTLENFFVSDSTQGSCYVKSKLNKKTKDLNKDFFNNQGFRDKDEFVGESVDTTALRILLLGDSFTYGINAVLKEEDGYADVLEKNLNKLRKTLLWNTGMPTIGQRQQLYMLKKYFPILKPKLIILGFYNGNDWEDNLYPMGRFYLFNCSNCKEKNGLVLKYKLLPNDSIYTLSPEEAWIRAYPAYKKSSNIIGVLENSKLLSLFINGTKKFIIEFMYKFNYTITNLKKYHKLHNPFPWEQDFLLIKPSVKEFNITFNLIKQINDYVKSNDSKLILLLIPTEDEVREKNKNGYYIEIVNICKNLNIDYIEVFEELNYDDYSNLHWTTKAHMKIGDILTNKILQDYY